MNSFSIDTLQQHPAIAMAQIQIETGNFSAALSILEDALRHEPLDRNLLHARAHTHIALQDIPKAEKDLDSIVSLFPDDAQSWDDRGVLFQWHGDYFRAAECHMRAVDLAPTEGAILNLAIALNHLKQREQSQKLYEAILQINPNNVTALINLAQQLDEQGKPQEAEALLIRARENGDASFPLAMTYGNLCRQQGRLDEAAEWYQLALSRNPQNRSAQFLLATVRGENPEAPPAEHVAELFDNYADTFETSLTDTLKYRAPEMLMAALEKEITALKQNDNTLTGIDLGAGTGLFGQLLRPHLGESVALDLSANMLQKAQEKNIYDRYIHADIVEGLQQFKPEHFDIISAADVFVYLGKLDDVFDAAANYLKPGGIFAFSTEAANDDDDTDYAVRDTGRYAHHETYLRNLAERHGFEIAHFERDWLRYNKKEPLDGFVAVLRKSS